MRKSLTVLLFFAAACGSEPAAAPVGPSQQIMGDLPTNRPFGEMLPDLTYDESAGSITFRVDVNHGIVNAARQGGSDFQLVISLEVRNDAGQGFVIKGNCVLGTTKPAVDPKGDPFEPVRQGFTWD